MSIDTDFASDISLFDGSATATLHRIGRVSSPESLTAIMLSTITSAVEAKAATPTTTADWLVAVPLGSGVPNRGDLFSVSEGVWAVEMTTGDATTGIVKCSCRLVAERLALPGRVDIQEATWHDQGSGPEPSAWSTVQPAVPAEIIPVDSKIDPAASPPQTTSRFHILLGEPPALSHNHRIVDQLGVTYRVDTFTPATGPGLPALVEATTESSVTA
ncbi:MAG: hypothetical protein AAGJ46_07790 [Planctomycetota bacterium]